MPTMTGHLRKGQNRPTLTGRTARRHQARIKARTFAREHGMPVITHVQRAVVTASRGGHLFASDFLRDLGLAEWERFASAFGKAVAKEYRKNHGHSPDLGGKSIANGRIRATYRYANELDLYAGALAYPRTAHLVAVPSAPEPATASEAFVPDDGNITSGDRVSLFVSECPDKVSGTVLQVYRNAIDVLVADVEIGPGDVRLQNVELLTKTSDGPSAHKLGLLDRWHGADAALRHHQVEHPVCAFAGQRWGCPDWRALNAAMDEIEAQMMDAGMPSPNAEIYAGDAGAAEFYADLV